MALPPPSLLVAMVVMTAVSLCVGVALARALRRWPARAATWLAAASAALLVLHAFHLNGSPGLARLVRSPDAIVWSNLSPVFAAMLVAAAWRTTAARWQRWLVLLAVCGVCLTQAYRPLFGRVPPTGPPRVAGGVHRQSTLSTCSAAAAATLLGEAGVATTEADMAELCLTRAGGTSQLGLYRGLRLKAPDAEVEFLKGDADAVAASSEPVIVSLGAPRSGWSPLPLRVGHSVVVLGRDASGNLDVADPMTGGRYPMSLAELRRLWAGEAMRLRPKR